MSSTELRIVALAAALVAPACTKDLALGFERFACTTDVDCIRGTVCDPGLSICVVPAEDATGTTDRDAGVRDARAPDAGFVDSGPIDTGPPIEVTWGTETSTHTNWWLYTDQTAAQVDEKLAMHNARITDLELQFTLPEWRYTVVLVENTGSFQRTSSWISDVPRSQLAMFGQRMIDLELARTGTAVHFSAVGIDDNNAWWWFWNFTREEGITGRLASYDATLLDLERYEDSGEQKLAVILVPRRNRVTAFHSAQSPRNLAQLVENEGVGLIELEYEETRARFSVATSTCPCARGAFVYDVDEVALRARCESDGMRIDRIEHYMRDSKSLFSAILIDNGQR